MSDPSSASNFLGQLWQVVGATVGLTVAVVFFVFQGVNAARPTAMRDARVAGPFQLVVYLGVSALFTIGLCLLGFGNDAPAGWAAAWAICISGLSIASVGLLVAVMLNVIDVARLHQARIRTITRQAATDVEADARLRIGLTLLDSFQESAGFELRALGTSNQPEGAVFADRAGIVADVDMHELRKLSAECSSAGLAAPQLLVYLGRHVTVGTPLLIVHSSDRDLLAIATQVVRVRSTKDRPSQLDLVRLASELHDEAIQAIRAAHIGAYDEIAEAQAALVLAIPEAWEATFGQRYTNELAASVFPLRLGPVSRVTRNVYEQVTAAISVDVREVALSAAYQPIHIAARAADAGASGLVSQMFGICQSLASIPPSSELATLVRDHVFQNFSQTLQFSISPVAEDESLPDDRRRSAADMIQHGLEVFAHIAKISIDSGDRALFEQVDRGWRHVHEFWLEDHAAPYRPASLNKDLAVAIQEARDRSRFAVACWLIRQILADPDNVDLNAMFAIVRPFYTAGDLVAAHAALNQSAERRELVSDWVMSSLPSGEVHVIDSTTPILRATALLMLASQKEAGTPLEPSQWLLSNAKGLSEAFDYLEEDPSAPALLNIGHDEFLLAVTATRSAIETASKQQSDLNEAELAAAMVPPETKARFKSLVEEAWTENRSMLGVILSSGGNLELDQGSAPSERLALRPTLQNKHWAVNPEQYGFAQVGREFGRALALGENRRIVELVASPTVVGDSTDSANELENAEVLFELTALGDLRQRVRDLVLEMQADGYHPSLILHSRSWNVVQAFPVDAIEESDRVDARAMSVRGQLDGLLVAQVRLPKHDEIVVVDVPAWCQVREWSSEAGGGLQATIETFTTDTGQAFLGEHPEVFGDISTEEERVQKLLTHMLLSVSVSSEVLVKEPRAVRSLTVWP